MFEKKSNLNGMTAGVEIELTDDLLEQVHGGMISTANLPGHQNLVPTVGPNLGDYADWYYYNAGFGATGGSSM